MITFLLISKVANVPWNTVYVVVNETDGSQGLRDDQNMRLMLYLCWGWWSVKVGISSVMNFDWI